VEFSEVSNYYGSLSRLEIPIARRTAGSEEYENRVVKRNTGRWVLYFFSSNSVYLASCGTGFVPVSCTIRAALVLPRNAAAPIAVAAARSPATSSCCSFASWSIRFDCPQSTYSSARSCFLRLLQATLRSCPCLVRRLEALFPGAGCGGGGAAADRLGDIGFCFAYKPVKTPRAPTPTHRRV